MILRIDYRPQEANYKAERLLGVYYKSISER